MAMASFKFKEGSSFKFKEGSEGSPVLRSPSDAVAEGDFIHGT